MKVLKLENGIAEQQRTQIAEGLSALLADTYTLYLKTQNYHWNVTGPFFQTLHTMFEGQYTELAMTVDTIAERIRALGAKAPGSYNEFAKLSSIDGSNVKTEAMEMVKDLLDDNEKVLSNARKLFPIAGEASDEATADLLTQRIQSHEKTAWMLRATLEK
jgi:starvation-inducible DNA-binding protein